MFWSGQIYFANDILKILPLLVVCLRGRFSPFGAERLAGKKRLVWGQKRAAKAYAKANKGPVR
jgi:hypothetical protein